MEQLKQVVILAGGKGTRLRERLGELPKPLVDLCGVPLLERQVELVKRHRFGQVLLLVNHGAQHIIKYCAAKRNWGLDLVFVDDGEPRGTAGATLAAFDRLAPEFLVMYGDTMLEVDLTRLHAFHKEIPGVAATLFVHPNDHPQDSDLVEVDDQDRIVAFHPYPREGSRDYPNLVNAGLYWIDRQALAPWRSEQGMLDFGKDLFPAMLARGFVLRACNSPEYIKDIGTPSRLDQVRADFLSGKIARASLERAQAMVFIDRDGTIFGEIEPLAGPDERELLPVVAPAIRRLNASDYRCALLSDGRRQIQNKLETLLGQQGAYLNRVYCADKAASIERAAEEFNLARAHSWLIGDESADIATARLAGLKSILVETGCAGLDYRAWASPDAIVPELGTAVSFILDEYPRLLSYCATLAQDIGEAAIVLIGGQSRSGKSTFASVLRDAIQARGGGAVVLAADRWLKTQHLRTTGVLGRYDFEALQTLLDALADPKRRPYALTLDGYHKLKRERMDCVERVLISSSDVVLIEGIVALALKTGKTIETHRLHVEIDEAARRQRVLSEYRLRGMTESQAMEVYLARREDEWPVVEDLASGARRVSLAR